MTKNNRYPLIFRDLKFNANFMQENKIGLSQIVPRVFNKLQQITCLRIKELKFW